MTRDIIQHLIRHDYSEHFCFVTDDVMPDTFVEKGHLNHLIKKAIHEGMRPEDAIYAGTVTPAKRMRLYDRGTIAPNKRADFILLDNLDTFEINRVYKNGSKVYDKNKIYEQEVIRRQFPADFYKSVNLKPLRKEDITITMPIEKGKQACRIIIVSDGTTFTQELIDELPVEDYQLQWQKSQYCLISVFERYGKNGNRALGLIGGDTIKKGAVASTYSHDNHNLLVVGKNQKDVLLAANTVIENQGGFCVAENGEILALVKLPVGGILSEEPLEQLAVEVKKLRNAMEHLGYKHYNPIMSFSTHSLAVSPELKITDFGLIKVDEGSIVPLYI
jgi:adenine deaminase